MHMAKLLAEMRVVLLAATFLAMSLAAVQAQQLQQLIPQKQPFPTGPPADKYVIGHRGDAG